LAQGALAGLQLEAAFVGLDEHVFRSRASQSAALCADQMTFACHAAMKKPPEGGWLAMA
jgi:hypothetical protein